MTINAWKTNFIGLNKPPKVLSGTADDFTPLSYWPYPNSSDDPYWSGGSNPQYYQWIVRFSVNIIGHGSNLTRTPFYYNAQDIEVGDFVAGAQDGKVCQIMSVLAKDDFSITAVVEDRLRYNTFRDPTGFGMFSTPGQVVFFDINELGFPMVDPIPGEASPSFFSNVMSRFQYMNPLTNYLLEKENNGFQQGDAICIEDGEFTLSDPDNVIKYIGTVVHPGPGPNQFILRPANGIIDFIPGLPGNVGDYIYPSIDGSGDLTTDDFSARPVFMKIANSIPSTSTGTTTNYLGTGAETFEINKVLIDTTTLAAADLDSVVTLINEKTSEHKVTASKVGAATESNSSAYTSAYGVVAGYIPFAAEINGVLVSFATTNSGTVRFGDPAVADSFDMATDINKANIENIEASGDGGTLTIRNINGAAITITNIQNDVNGNPFVGPNSLTSLSEETDANSTNFTIRLSRNDGGPLSIRDISGAYLTSIGLMSGQTGRYALGLNIEQGLRTSSTIMVADIAARDALYPLPGDQSYVINAGDGEWAMFVWDGAAWNRFNNQRSDATDARTLTASFDFTSVTSGNQRIGFISADRRILDINVEVVSASGNTVEIVASSSAGTSVVMESEDSVLSKVGEYGVVSNYKTSAYTEVSANLSVTTTQGYIIVNVTYV